MKIKDWDGLSADAELTLKLLGEGIRTARQRRELTAKSFALRMGVDPRTLSQLESGSPRVSFGVFVQALSLLGLSRGIEEVVKPENDLRVISEEIKRLRSGRGKAVRIKKTDVDF